MTTSFFRCATSFVALLLSAGTLLAQDNYPRNNGIDVISYVFDITVNDSTDVIEASTEVYFEVPGIDAALILDLTSVDSSNKGMKVSAVSINNTEVVFQHKNDRLEVMGLLGAGRYTAKIEYSGIPADGLIIGKNKHGSRTFFGDNWPNRAHHYLAVVDHPYDKALSEFVITAPSKYKVVSNGMKKGESDAGNGFTKTHWKSEQVLPTKVMVFGAANFSTQMAGKSGDIPVHTWVFPEEEQEGFYDYALAVEILDWFVTKLGPYPYNQLSNVQSKTRYGGMENAGCIFYHENSIDGKRGSEELFAHEIAHQWYGNSASEADWYHVWLSEGFATYLTQVYMSEKHGEDVFKSGMQKAADKAKAWSGRVPNASVVDTSIKNLNQLLSPATYQRAAWVLHMLRRYIGDESFWKGMKGYYDKYQFSNAVSDQFEEVMQENTAVDLSSFMAAWLYQPGFPQFEYSLVGEGSERKLIVRQTGDQFFPVRMDCSVQFKGKVKDKDGKPVKSIMHSELMTERELIIPIQGSVKIADVVLDPGNNILK